jgi:hypothetical protein
MVNLFVTLDLYRYVVRMTDASENLLSTDVDARIFQNRICLRADDLRCREHFCADVDHIELSSLGVISLGLCLVRAKTMLRLAL